MVFRTPTVTLHRWLSGTLLSQFCVPANKDLIKSHQYNTCLMCAIRKSFDARKDLMRPISRCAVSSNVRRVIHSLAFFPTYQCLRVH